MAIAHMPFGSGELINQGKKTTVKYYKLMNRAQLLFGKFNQYDA
jgi:hypothetical protein